MNQLIEAMLNLNVFWFHELLKARGNFPGGYKTISIKNSIKTQNFFFLL